jgi:uncharacterized membrane protein YfcA
LIVLPLTACVLIGLVSGFLNVLAAGGSFLTLPLLLFLGLPASIANGTNRVGVLAQNIGGVWGFHRHDVIEWRWALTVGAISDAGAAIGAWAAIGISDLAFRRVLSILMVVVTLVTLVLRRYSGIAPGGAHRSPRHWTMITGFFIVGLYGGFIQAGVGFLILAMTSIAGMDLVRGNAVKVLTVMLLTLLSLAIFAGTGNVNWPLGLALGAGNLAGASVGVRLAVLRGHRWLEQIVFGAVIVFAVLLWLTE